MSSGLQLAGPAVDLGIAEAVEGEARLPGLHAAARAACSWSVALARAQRAGAQLAVLEHLGVAQGDRLPGRALHVNAQPADQVLAEVDERLARRARW